MAYLKLLHTATASGERVVRVLVGENEEQLRLAGTLVVADDEYEQIVDVLVMGASMVNFLTGKLHVRFGPDESNAA